MPTIPMLTDPAVPDAWHAVTAPGGYEWRYFDAEDATADLRIVAILFQGFVFHPGYRRAFDRYRRHPTRVPPPLPADYPCAYFVVYRGGEILSQFMTQHPPAEFSASSDRPAVRVGPNSFERADDGALRLLMSGTPWHLTGRGPQLLTGQTLTGTFNFRPSFGHDPMQRTFFQREWSGADHHWVLADPLCAVTGRVELKSADRSVPPVAFDLNGRGYHDHNYGTGPIGPGLRRWMWGRVLLDEHACIFHYAQPDDGADEFHLIETDPFGTRELTGETFSADWSGRTATLLRYPKSIDAGPLQLRSPRVVDSSPFYLRIAYDARLRGQTGRAFCEVAYPHRLQWPVLGRMIEMSITNG